MIWLTWRQFRAQGYFAAAVLVAAATVLTFAGVAIAHLWAGSGAASCPATGDCPALESFIDETTRGWLPVAYIFGTALTYLAPPLIGVFWGAPLVARELETGTQRLVWTQSATRARWLATKLSLLGLAAMAFAGLLSLAATLSGGHLDTAAANRLEPMLFGARGVVPVAYAAFAFVLGVLAGMVIRRTVPAMATTLGVYAVAVLAMALGLRGHLLPAKHLTKALDVLNINGFGIHNDTVLSVRGDPGLPGAWVLQNTTVDTSGAVFTGPANPQFCGRRTDPQDCLNWVGTLGLRQQITYQPASRFWAMQWTEAGLFLVLTALLVAAGFWWLRRRSA